uniref:Ubiquitin fusion degradation protein 1 homolog n=1 Tax=Parastrongyloides trichosuri TaxID=131310 RepID=A0A0N5A3L4_PARTI
MLHHLMENFGISMMPYKSQLRCFSMAFYGNADHDKIAQLNFGGKILLPSSALDYLMRGNIEYPMMFKLSNVKSDVQKVTHCGVLEFSAEEGKVYLPIWMMRQLLLNDGDHVSIEYVQLPKASYAKLKPQSVDFLDITDPRAVLETELAKYCCFTINDLITFRYNDTDYSVKVIELKPANAVSVIECDLNVDFAPPEGYQEPEFNKPNSEMPEAPELPSYKEANAKVFQGTGVRLDGKDKKRAAKGDEKEIKMKALPDIIINESYTPGTLNFTRYNYKNRVIMAQSIKEHNDKITGGGFETTGYSTRNKKRY